MSEVYDYIMTGRSKRVPFRSLKVGDDFYDKDGSECTKTGRSHARRVYNGDTVFVAPHEPILPVEARQIEEQHEWIGIKRIGPEPCGRWLSGLTVVKLNIDKGTFEVTADPHGAIPERGTCYLDVAMVSVP